MSELAFPTSADVLYLSRDGGVSACRPVMTGDVFADIEIPGVDDGRASALILAHPCSMRRGAHLRDHVMMCRVADGTPIQLAQWPGGFFGVMPLPELDGSGGLGFRATFELAGRVPTASLDLSKRIASLDEVGVALLLQRLAYSYTRAVIEQDTIHESVAHLLAEAELLEEWVEARTERLGLAPDAAAIRAAEAEFDAFMSETDPAARITNRTKLRDPAAGRRCAALWQRSCRRRRADDSDEIAQARPPRIGDRRWGIRPSNRGDCRRWVNSGRNVCEQAPGTDRELLLASGIEPPAAMVAAGLALIRLTAIRQGTAADRHDRLSAPRPVQVRTSRGFPRTSQPADPA